MDDEIIEEEVIDEPDTPPPPPPPAISDYTPIILNELPGESVRGAIVTGMKLLDGVTDTLASTAITSGAVWTALHSIPIVNEVRY